MCIQHKASEYCTLLYFKREEKSIIKKTLDRDAIKYIAIFAMLLDHIAWIFLDFGSPLAQIFHIVGRITAPIMCFFIDEGYHYTRNKRKYALRLLIFAFISQISWWLMHGKFFTLSFNVIFTLFLGLLAVHVEATYTDDKIGKIILIFLICLASFYCDWQFYAVLWCVIFYKYRDNKQKKYILFSAVGIAYFIITVCKKYSVAPAPFNNVISSLYTLGILLCIPILMQYNGEKGKYKISKWVFYIFYPLHMAVIGIISLLCAN